MVVCRRNPDTDHFQDHPVIVVEVLSDSTRRIDLTEKREAYLTIGTLKELIFIEPDQPRVIVYRRKIAGGFDSEEYVGLASSIALSGIDSELTAEELYEGIDFTIP
jgi:Uma2 family endonuclease